MAGVYCEHFGSYSRFIPTCCWISLSFGKSCREYWLFLRIFGVLKEDFPKSIVGSTYVMNSVAQDESFHSIDVVYSGSEH